MGLMSVAFVRLGASLTRILLRADQILRFGLTLLNHQTRIALTTAPNKWPAGASEPSGPMCNPPHAGLHARSVAKAPAVTREPEKDW